MSADGSATTVAAKILARQDSDEPALYFEDQTWSWRALVTEARQRFALWSALRDPAAPPHIGILLDNTPDYLFWLAAGALGGMTVVGINSTYRGAELQQLITHTDCQLLVIDDEHRPLLEGLELPVASERTIVVDRPDHAQALDTAPPADLPDVAESDLALLIFTSGSTGAPKAVRCTQGRWAGTGDHVARIAAIGPGDVVYPPLPLFHSSALFTGWSSALHAGVPVVLRRRFSASGFLPDVRKYGVTFVAYTGRVLNYILATPERADDADNPLRLAVGNEAAKADIATFTRRFGCEVRDSYGSTEGLIIVRRQPGMPEGALGKGDDGVEVLDPDTEQRTEDAKFDAHGALLNEDSAVGELVQLHPERRFEGYYLNAEADRLRLRNGVFWSGDLAYRDADGWIYFAGRNNDWLRVDGENFAAVAVERILSSHPDVRAVAVYAVPDPAVGDQVMAALQMHDGTSFEPAAFDAFLDDHPDLSPKWRPTLVRLVEELPILASYKPDKRLLRRQGAACEGPLWQRTSRTAPLVKVDR